MRARAALISRRQGLADDVSVETAEVFANRAQQLPVRYRETPSITPDAAFDSRLKTTSLIEVARRCGHVNHLYHLFARLWKAGRRPSFLGSAARLPSAQLNWSTAFGINRAKGFIPCHGLFPYRAMIFISPACHGVVRTRGGFGYNPAHQISFPFHCGSAMPARIRQRLP